MVLACSRLMFVRPVLTMDQRAWTECHVEAFAFFGGVPRRPVPDNLRTGVGCVGVVTPSLSDVEDAAIPWDCHTSNFVSDLCKVVARERGEVGSLGHPVVNCGGLPLL
jgi:hypothetical protein